MTLPAPALERLRAARRIVALTGAGISAESGLPTFRDPMTGLWARYRPEDLATPEAFARQPDREEWARYDAAPRRDVGLDADNPGILTSAVKFPGVRCWHGAFGRISRSALGTRLPWYSSVLAK